MTYDVATVDEYCDLLPEDRKKPFIHLREAVLKNLPEGFQETMYCRLPSYVVPHTIYPAGYHCNPKDPLPYLSIASQKHFIGYYHMGIYSMPNLLQWFQIRWEKKELGKLDIGKCVIRLKKITQIPYDLFGELTAKLSVQEWIDFYEKAIRRD